MEPNTLAFLLCLSPSRSLSLSLLLVAFVAANGHGEGVEAGGIRARVSEGVFDANINHTKNTFVTKD
jgi:hypothetical protein